MFPLHGLQTLPSSWNSSLEQRNACPTASPFCHNFPVEYASIPLRRVMPALSQSNSKQSRILLFASKINLTALFLIYKKYSVKISNPKGVQWQERVYHKQITEVKLWTWTHWATLHILKHQYVYSPCCPLHVS